MTDALPFIATFAVAMLVGMFVGITLHELSHFVVLQAAGVQSQLLWPSLDDGRLTFAVGFWTDGQTPQAVRASALAPLATGLVLVLVCVTAEVWTMDVSVLAFSVGTIMRTVRLSRADIQSALGHQTA